MIMERAMIQDAVPGGCEHVGEAPIIELKWANSQKFAQRVERSHMIAL